MLLPETHGHFLELLRLSAISFQHSVATDKEHMAQIHPVRADHYGLVQTTPGLTEIGVQKLRQKLLSLAAL